MMSTQIFSANNTKINWELFALFWSQSTCIRIGVHGCTHSLNAQPKMYKSKGGRGDFSFSFTSLRNSWKEFEQPSAPNLAILFFLSAAVHQEIRFLYANDVTFLLTAVWKLIIKKKFHKTADRWRNGKMWCAWKYRKTGLRYCGQCMSLRGWRKRQGPLIDCYYCCFQRH